MANIPQGPGNLNPEKEFLSFIANGAITAGESVAYYGTTGYTVDQASATLFAIGVAAETAADGAWFKVQIGGHCDLVTNDGTDVAAGDLLVATAAGVVFPKTMAEVAADVTVGWAMNVIGIAMQADTSTTCTNVQLLNRVSR